MHTSSIVLATFITLSSFFSAQAFERKTLGKKVEGLALTESVLINELDNTQLQSVASGIRKKYIVVGINVYLGELLLPASITWDKKPATVESAPQVGILMSFLREVPAKNISESFSEALKENSIDTKAPEVSKFLDAIKKIGDIQKKESILLARTQAKDGDKLLILVPNRFEEVISGPSGWTQNVLKIWTGKTSDKGLKELQKAWF